MHRTQHSATMIYLSGIVGFLLVLTAEARVGKSTELEFCSETEQCLLFDLICKTDEYEARHYSSVKWVSTNETSIFMEVAAFKAFRRLYGYISGANENGKKIQMTSPVVMKKFDWSMWGNGVYTMSFLLPAEHQMNPPKPTDDKVFFDDMPDMKMYVKSYGGWINNLSDLMKARSLASTLDINNEKYEKDFRYAVGYNSPMTILNRHNEVWLVAKGDPKCGREDHEFSPFS